MKRTAGLETELVIGFDVEEHYVMSTYHAEAAARTQRWVGDTAKAAAAQLVTAAKTAAARCARQSRR